MDKAPMSSVRSRVAFFEQFKQGPDEGVSSCGKRAREVESITSPGMVRQTTERLLSPAAEKPTVVDHKTKVTVSPGKVRQSVETIINLSRHGDENTPPSKKPRTSSSQLVMQDSTSVSGSSGKVQQCVEDMEAGNTSTDSTTKSSPHMQSPPKDALVEGLQGDATEKDVEEVVSAVEAKAKNIVAQVDGRVDVEQMQLEGMGKGKEDGIKEKERKEEEEEKAEEEETSATTHDAMVEQTPIVEDKDLSGNEDAAVAHEAADTAEKAGAPTGPRNPQPPPSPARPAPSAGPPPAPASSSQKPSSLAASLVPVAEDGVLAATGAVAKDAGVAMNTGTMHTTAVTPVTKDGAAGLPEEALELEAVGGVMPGSPEGSVCSPAEKERRALILTRSLDNSTRSGKRRRHSEAPADLPV